MTRKSTEAAKAVKDLSGFKVDIDDSMMGRLAKYIVYCGEKAPGRCIPYSMAAKVVLILPKAGNDGEIKKIRSIVARARKLMVTEYGVGLLSIPGMGLRATTDADDIVDYQYEKDARRVAGAIKSMDMTRSIIDVNKIKDVDKKRRVNDLSKAVKTLTSADVIAKLLPPKKEEPEKK